MGTPPSHSSGIPEPLNAKALLSQQEETFFNCALPTKGKHFYSSSESEEEEEAHKKFNIKIKPLQAKDILKSAATVDELKASIGNIALSPSPVVSPRVFVSSLGYKSSCAPQGSSQVIRKLFLRRDEFLFMSSFIRSSLYGTNNVTAGRAQMYRSDVSSSNVLKFRFPAHKTEQLRLKYTIPLFFPLSFNATIIQDINWIGFALIPRAFHTTTMGVRGISHPRGECGVPGRKGHLSLHIHGINTITLWFP